MFFTEFTWIKNKLIYKIETDYELSGYLGKRVVGEGDWELDDKYRVLYLNR